MLKQAHLSAMELQRKQQISNLLNEDQYTLIQMSSQEFIELVVSAKKTQGLNSKQAMNWIVHQINDVNLNHHWHNNQDILKSISSYIPVAVDAIALRVLAVEIQRSGNMFSTFQIKTYAVKAHILFKGYHGLRSHLTGTRYLANNPKVIQLGAGKLGAMNAIKTGFMISIIISAVFHSLDQLLDDQLTWHHFFAGIAVDVTIALGSTTIAAGLVTLAVGTATMVTIGPLIAVVIIGSLITFGANLLIDSNKLTNQFAHLLITAESNLSRQIISIKKQTKQIQRQANEDPIGFMHRLFAIPQFRGVR